MTFLTGPYGESISFQDTLAAIDIPSLASAVAGVFGNIYMGNPSIYIQVLLFEAVNLVFAYTQSSELPLAARRESKVVALYWLFSALPCLLYAGYYLTRQVQASPSFLLLEYETFCASVNASFCNSINASSFVATPVFLPNREKAESDNAEMAWLANVAAALLPYLMRQFICLLAAFCAFGNIQAYEKELFFFLREWIKKKCSEKMKPPALQETKEGKAAVEQSEEIKELLIAFANQKERQEGVDIQDRATSAITQGVDFISNLNLREISVDGGVCNFDHLLEQVELLRGNLIELKCQLGSGYDEEFLKEKVSDLASEAEKAKRSFEAYKEHYDAIRSFVRKETLTRKRFEEGRHLFFFQQALDFTDPEFQSLQQYQESLRAVVEPFQSVDTILESLSQEPEIPGGIRLCISSLASTKAYGDEQIVGLLQAHAKFFREFPKEPLIKSEQSRLPLEKTVWPVVEGDAVDLFAVFMVALGNIYLKNPAEKIQVSMFLVANILAAFGQVMKLEKMECCIGLLSGLAYCALWACYIVAFFSKGDFRETQSIWSVFTAAFFYTMRMSVKIYHYFMPSLSVCQAELSLNLEKCMIKLISKEGFHRLGVAKSREQMERIATLQGEISVVRKSTYTSPVTEAYKRRLKEALSVVKETYCSTQGCVHPEDAVLRKRLDDTVRPLIGSLGSVKEYAEEVGKYADVQERIDEIMADYQGALFKLLNTLVKEGSLLEKILDLNKAIASAQAALGEAEDKGLEVTGYQKNLQILEGIIRDFFYKGASDNYCFKKELDSKSLRAAALDLRDSSRMAPESIRVALELQRGLFLRPSQRTSQGALEVVTDSSNPNRPY